MKHKKETAIPQAELVTAPQNGQENLRLLLEATPAAVVTVDNTGQIRFVNAKLEEMFGYHREALLGQEVEILLPEQSRLPHIRYRQNYTDNPHIRSMGSGLDLAGRRKDGSEFPIEVGLSYVTIEGELLIMALITDITLRKQATEILERRVRERTQEIERRRQVADGLREILTVLNSNRPLVEILDHIVAQASRLLQAEASAIYQLEEDGESLMIQTNYGLPESYRPEGRIILDAGLISQMIHTRRPVVIPNLTALQGAEKKRVRWQILAQGGYRALLAVPMIVKDEIYGSLKLYYTTPREFSSEEIDLAVTFADQAALAVENAQLRTQAEQAAVAAERSRLARDLHDSVTQNLFSASLIAEVLPRLWERKHSEGQQRLEELRQLTRGALAEMRTLLLELRPSRLIQVELSELLQQLAEAVTGRARIPIQVQIQGQCTLEPEVRVALYRVAQEALNNVAKHSRASQVNVTLDCHPARAELVIKDNGRGFIMEGIKPNNLGLKIMQERTEAIGADLEIDSQVDHGTQVKVIWEEKPQSRGRKR
jgi:PAS domain S-box-containing protein